MKVCALHTHRIQPEEAIEDVLFAYLPSLKEKTIVGITSKILSYTENRLIEKENATKQDLIEKEAEVILRCPNNPHGFQLTLKDHIMMASAGIDESNAKGCYVLLPKNIMKSAAHIWKWLKKTYNLTHVGVIITDSQSIVLRPGVKGVGLGFCGFKPLYSYKGTLDLDQRIIKTSQLNVLDSLATTLVFMMGEGAEQTPLALMEEAPRVVFSSAVPTKKEKEAMHITPKDDLYLSLLSQGRWEKL